MWGKWIRQIGSRKNNHEDEKINLTSEAVINREYEMD